MSRLLDEPDVTFEALMQPHYQHTREHLEARWVVLLVQDSTELDLTTHTTMTGLGQIGNEGGRGLHLQTMLAVRKTSREVLGCAQQEVFVRTPAPRGEQRYQRRKRAERETDVWMRLVKQLGSPSASCSLSYMEGIAQQTGLPSLLPVCPPTPSFWSEPPKTGGEPWLMWDICWTWCARGPASTKPSL